MPKMTTGKLRHGTKSEVLRCCIVALWALASSCTPLRIQYPLAASEADWQTDGRSIQRDRVALDQPLKLPLEQAWIYNAGGGFAEGSPLIVDNIVIVGTRQGEIHVVDLVDGQEVGSGEFGQSIEGTPALSGQVLFVPNAWGKYVLSAFDLQRGSYLWRFKGVPIEAAVLPMGSMVVVGDVEGNVIALDKESGRVIWVYEFGDLASILSGPAAIDMQLVAVADETGRVALLRADSGREVWTTDLGSPVEAGLAVGHGLIYVPTTRGRFVALRTDDGAIAWEHRSDSDQVRFTAAAVTDDDVIFGGTDGIMRSLGAENGASVWTFHTDGTIAAAPVVNGSIVFVGSMDEKVYAVHRDNGSIQWETPLRGRVKSSPAVRNGYLIVMSEPRYIYAFTNAANIQN